MPNEASVHAQEYGFGGSFFEDEFFDTDDEDNDLMTMDEEDMNAQIQLEWGGTVLEMCANN